MPASAFKKKNKHGGRGVVRSEHTTEYSDAAARRSPWRLELARTPTPARIVLGDRGVDSFFFFFNDPATTEIYPLSLHDALPICRETLREDRRVHDGGSIGSLHAALEDRSEEHTSELQSLAYLVCRLLVVKKTVGNPLFAIPRIFDISRLKGTGPVLV